MGFSKIIDGFFETCYRKKGVILRIPTQENIMVQKGYYMGNNNGAVGISIDGEMYYKMDNNVETRLVLKQEEMIKNFMQKSSWNKEFLNRIEITQISNNFAEYMTKDYHPNSNTLRIGEGNNLAADISAALKAVIYFILTKIIFKNKCQFVEEDAKVYSQIISKFDDYYTNKKIAGYITEDIEIAFNCLKFNIDNFLGIFVDEYIKIEICTVGDAIVDGDLKVANDTIKKAAEVLNSIIPPDISTITDYIALSDIIMPALMEDNLFLKLIKDLGKISKNKNNIKTLFNENSLVEMSIFRNVDSCLGFERARRLAFEKRAKELGYDSSEDVLNANSDYIKSVLDYINLKIEKNDTLFRKSMTYYGTSYISKRVEVELDKNELQYCDPINQIMSKMQEMVNKLQKFIIINDKTNSSDSQFSLEISNKYIRNINIKLKQTKNTIKFISVIGYPYTDLVSDLKWGVR